MRTLATFGFAALLLAGCDAPVATAPTPATQAFDGSWTGTFTSSGGVALDGGVCTDATGEGVITNGEMDGSANTRYGLFQAKATVAPGGAIEGTFFNVGGTGVGMFTGAASGPDSFAGTFEDSLGCDGTWVMQRA
jgi:hypothetical protein